MEIEKIYMCYWNLGEFGLILGKKFEKNLNILWHILWDYK